MVALCKILSPNCINHVKMNKLGWFQAVLFRLCAFVEISDLQVRGVDST